MTARLDVTDLVAYSKKTNTKFYINFLYLLSKALNSRDDYKMAYNWKTQELICYDVVNPTHYVFHDDTETITIVYSEYHEDYETFYANAMADVERQSRRGNTVWTWQITRTGLTRRIFRGCRTIRSISSCRTGICISCRLSTGDAIAKKTADFKCR